ncbi:MAG TPA: DUF4416 family protein [Desulfosalsimonadaceae bacterium]|nr:DUF4416 family protein [Desulfosalsimonadaceae bacterium]
MSRPAPPKPAKLVIGLFTKHTRLIQPVLERLQETFGQIDIISPWFAFNWTDYYEPEMGSRLQRRMTAFGPHINQADLPDIKLHTNAIEETYTIAGSRQINIDPGYLLAERFVLATGKNYTHRIYLGQNIYADLTLIYQHGKFQALPWTYPDYTEAPMHTFLIRVRSKYLKDLKADGQL